MRWLTRDGSDWYRPPGAGQAGCDIIIVFIIKVKIVQPSVLIDPSIDPEQLEQLIREQFTNPAVVVLLDWTTSVPSACLLTPTWHKISWTLVWKQISDSSSKRGLHQSACRSDLKGQTSPSMSPPQSMKQYTPIQNYKYIIYTVCIYTLYSIQTVYLDTDCILYTMTGVTDGEDRSTEAEWRVSRLEDDHASIL